MKALIVILMLAAVFLLIKLLIDLYMILIMLNKDKELLKQKNELEQHYQFIKGLY